MTENSKESVDKEGCQRQEAITLSLDHKEIAENFIGWYDALLNASVWCGLPDVAPHDAALLLCQFNPHEESVEKLAVFDATVISNGQTNSNDVKLLIQVFASVANNDGSPTRKRSLLQWQEIACDQKLKIHSWLSEYQSAIEQLDNCRYGDARKGYQPIREWGLTKQEILAVDWPMPSTAPPMENILDEVPKWVDEACKKIGTRGKGAAGSHRWNPAILSVCLNTKTPHKKWIVGGGTLTSFLRRNFPEYLDEWEKASLPMTKPAME